MDLVQLLAEFKTHKKDTDSIVKRLTEISRLERDRMENLAKLQAQMDKLDDLVAKLDPDAPQSSALADWTVQYRQELTDSQEQLRNRFGTELERELEQRGLHLSGQYPDLKAGLFEIELDFQRGQATIWYGPKQERLDKCPLSVAAVAAHIDKAGQQLGTRSIAEGFLDQLQKAYARVPGGEQRDPVPIIRVLSEMAHILQSSRFHQDPRRENYRGYSRADFSYDLFWVRQSNPHTLAEKGLHLVVATIDDTKRRRDFLWVPDDENGKGTMYSRLQFKEVGL